MKFIEFIGSLNIPREMRRKSHCTKQFEKPKKKD